MLMPTNSPDGPTRYSLWRELVDGSVSVWVRVLINLALAALAGGLAFLLSFVLAAVVPPFRYRWAYGLRPTDELMVGVFVLCGLGFLGASVWLWSRRSRHQALLRPTLWTMGIGTATTVLCVVAVDTFHGAEHIVLFGLVRLAGGWVMLIWTNAWYQMSRGRPMRNAGDGLPDIRCPKCGYRMVGLRECRCPECGGSYTLDELLASQDFARPIAPGAPAERGV